ncbi:MAG: F0F1 ATP synthase subunit A [Oscillospiraceae bacterium]|nr:F0F1 ATP synthase subunit A [Oscillospiraceae bacterium]
MEPTIDLEIKNYAVLNLFGLEVWITDTMVATWILMGILIGFAIFVRIKVSTFKEVPTGFQNVIEALIETFEGYLKSTVGDKLMFLGNWFFTLFLFILLSNLSGLIPGMRPPTADWSMTFGLALVTFCLIQIMGVRYRKGQYIKDLFAPLPWWCPIPLFLPINVIGELARPISLSFRLFGNMLAGLIMMSLVYALTPIFTQFLIPSFLHAYFDLFSGVLQAYIFVTLSMTFVAGAAEVTQE